MIDPSETEIVGSWIEADGRVVGDDACDRVESLTQNYLEKVGYSTESGGWDTLFRDPTDGRYWVRTYPHSNWHGGGPPALFSLTEAKAKKQFPDLF